METLIKKPLIMIKAKRQKEFILEEGFYCDDNDKWSNIDITNVTTWSQSSTSNLGFYRSDPDADKDD